MIRGALLGLAGVACTPASALAAPARECTEAAEAGQTSRGAGRLREARVMFERCQQLDCPAIVRADCATWLSEVAHATPSVIVVVQDDLKKDLSKVRITVDGTPIGDELRGRPISLDPGPHVFHLERAGESKDETIVVVQGEKERLLTVIFPRPRVVDAAAPVSLSQVPVDAPAPLVTTDERAKRHVGLVLGGLGIVALGAGAYVGLSYNSDVRELRRTCGSSASCSDDDVGPLSSQRTAAIVVSAAGAAMLVAGAFLFFTANRGGVARTSGVAIGPANGGFAARLSGSF